MFFDQYIRVLIPCEVNGNKGLTLTLKLTDSRISRTLSDMMKEKEEERKGGFRLLVEETEHLRGEGEEIQLRIAVEVQYLYVSTRPPFEINEEASEEVEWIAVMEYLSALMNGIKAYAEEEGIIRQEKADEFNELLETDREYNRNDLYNDTTNAQRLIVRLIHKYREQADNVTLEELDEMRNMLLKIRDCNQEYCDLYLKSTEFEGLIRKFLHNTQ